MLNIYLPIHADKAWAAGAGKTYTMEGTRENPGINYRTMKELFRCARHKRGFKSTLPANSAICSSKRSFPVLGKWLS